MLPEPMTEAERAGLQLLELDGHDPHPAAPPQRGAAPRREAPARRPWRVPVEAAPVAGAAALLAALLLGPTHRGVLAAAVLPLLVVLSAVDVRYRIVPNRVVAPALAGVLAFQLLTAPGQAFEWIAGAIGAPLVLLAPALFDRRAVGMGDVKLGAVLGAALGLQVVGAMLVASLALVPVAGFLIATGGRSARRTAVPFVPFLSLGAAIVLLA